MYCSVTFFKELKFQELRIFSKSNAYIRIIAMMFCRQIFKVWPSLIVSALGDSNN